MYLIDKRFDFCYGHRVHTQQLIGEYCERGDTSCKCRHPHGHQGTVHVFLEADELNGQGMVVDFKHLGWLKDWIDTYIDHKFIIDINDPMFKTMVMSPFTVYSGHVLYDHVDLNPVFVHDKPELLMGHTLRVPDVDPNNPRTYHDQSYHELLSGFFVVDFVPTSENLSAWLAELVMKRMQPFYPQVRLSRLEWFETPKSRSTYMPGDRT